MARKSFFAVYVLFKSEDEAAAWEARLPERPAPEAGGEEGEVAADAPWECHLVTSIRDDRGGYFEGAFRKITGRDGEAIATMVRGIADRCYEPRKDGFVWSELAPISKGKPGAFGTYVAPMQDGGEGVALIGGGGSSADF